MLCYIMCVYLYDSSRLQNVEGRRGVNVCVSLCNSSKQHILIKLRLYQYLFIHSQAPTEFLNEVVPVFDQK